MRVFIIIRATIIIIIIFVSIRIIFLTKVIITVIIIIIHIIRNSAIMNEGCYAICLLRLFI